MRLHTACPIATLNELNIPSSPFPDMIHIHRYECMRVAKSGREFDTQRNVCLPSNYLQSTCDDQAHANQMSFMLCRTGDSASVSRRLKMSLSSEICMLVADLRSWWRLG